jgi:ribonuclease J
MKACNKVRRQFIIDVYAAQMLGATGNKRLPQAGWNGIKVFLPSSQEKQLKRQGKLKLADSYGRFQILLTHLAQAAPKSVMLFRPSMMEDVERAGCLNGSRLIYSMWSGYLKDANKFREWLRHHEIPLVECHTSGHASVQDLVKLRKAFPTAPVVPIHTVSADRFEGLFGNVQRHNDGEWWTVL